MMYAKISLNFSHSVFHIQRTKFLFTFNLNRVCSWCQLFFCLGNKIELFYQHEHIHFNLKVNRNQLMWVQSVVKGFGDFYLFLFWKEWPPATFVIGSAKSDSSVIGPAMSDYRLSLVNKKRVSVCWICLPLWQFCQHGGINIITGGQITEFKCCLNHTE